LRLIELMNRTSWAANSVHHKPPTDPPIAGLTSDSRAVRPGYLFAALAGSKADGASFIADALARGAAALLVGPNVRVDNLDSAIPVIVDPEPRHRLALMASAFAGPQPEMQVAVTGTSGKSSTVHFVRTLWKALGLSSASVGTLGIMSDPILRSGALTTPDPVALHADLAELARHGVTHVALEASSHGLDQHRLDGLHLSAAAFTNLTHEHLDYHADMDAYLAAKLRLFRDLLPESGTAVINADSSYGEAVVAACRKRGLRTWTYGNRGAELRLARSVPHPGGQHLDLEILGHRYSADLPLIGDFQAANVLAALGLVLASGCDADRAVDEIHRLQGARGRVELVCRHPSGAPVLVDYAHKPQALEVVLETLRATVRGRLVVVFGCGGDRDRAKRPIMGEIATRLADFAVVTDDNPRSEDPAAIRHAIVEGIPVGRINYVEIASGRRDAIARGMAALKGPGDLLVIAGKGHETGQTIGKEVLPFDDAEVARELAAQGQRPPTTGEAG